MVKANKLRRSERLKEAQLKRVKEGKTAHIKTHKQIKQSVVSEKSTVQQYKLRKSSRRTRKSVSTNVSLTKGKTSSNVKSKPSSTAGVSRRTGNRAELTTVHHKEVDNIFSEITAQHVVDISTKTEKYPKGCFISAMVVLSENTLVFVDYWNSQIKLVDTVANAVVSAFRVGVRLYGLCKKSCNSVAVTDHIDSSVIFVLIHVQPNVMFSVEREIPITGTCIDIAMTDDRMFVTVRDPPGLKIMDRDGIVLNTVDINTHLYPNVALGPDNKYVYVSVEHEHRVVCLDLDGSIIATYMDDDLRWPNKIATDRRGIIYVPGQLSNNVHVVTADCRSKIKALLDKDDGLNDIHSMCYCNATQRLFIGKTGCGDIKVFQVQ